MMFWKAKKASFQKKKMIAMSLFMLQIPVVNIKVLGKILF